MKTDVVMPQMGESIAEGTVTRWLKRVGETVDRDEPLFEISTDKVDAEIPSPAAGVLTAIHVHEGATAAVQAVVATIEAGDGVTGVSTTAGPAEAGPHRREADGSDGGGVAAWPPDDALRGAGRVDVPAGAGGALPRARGAQRKVSPVARRIARELGVDLGAVSATGPRVTKADVLGHAGRGSPARPLVPGAGTLRDEVVPMSVMRRAIAKHMVDSRRLSAHVHSVFVVDCSRVEAWRRARRAEMEAAGVRLSIMPFVVKAAAAALAGAPLLNASLDGDRVVYHDEVNVGIAVALEQGLIVPVIRRADTLSVVDLARAIADLASRARAKRLKPEEVGHGTFTVTNPGNFGGAFATPIINQPQVAILELGTVEPRPAVVHDAIAIRPMMHLTLGFDHRLVDGVVADRYLGAVKRALETW
ncbi:MAG: 2-oxo acid dehydrogenase subunit E2 [Acidimicrobiia bacterium]|nr:2-oxo acid dehydrogenase subunit E2 [Acidimicrobiia bacterium]